MFKNILVPVTGFSGDKSALATGYLTGRLFDAHLDCLHVRPDAAQMATRAAAEDFGSVLMAAELFDALKTED